MAAKSNEPNLRVIAMQDVPTFAKAVIFKAPHKVEVADVRLGALGPTDVAVRTAFSWISPGDGTIVSAR